MSFSGETSEQRSKADTIGSIITLPSVFHFWNGDEFTGEYLILRDKQKFLRNGQGEYRTSDGQIYEGIWNADTLVENCKITYRDKSVFSGYLEDMVMQGPGKYTFKEGVTISGEFFNNRFVGKVFLTDPNGHLWESVSEEGDILLFFRPLHPYWQSLLNRPIPSEQLFYGESEEPPDV